MLEPDSTIRVPPAEGAPGGFGPNAIQILTAEHWSLLASRGLVYTEAMSRTSVSYTHLTLQTIYSV